MNLRSHLCLLLLLFTMFVSTSVAQKEKSASELMNEALNSGDPVEKITKACEAAKKDKKFQTNCTGYVLQLNGSDNDKLDKAETAYEDAKKAGNGDFSSAERYLSRVSGYDPGIAKRKAQLSADILAAKSARHFEPPKQDDSKRFYDQMVADWGNGDPASALRDYDQIKSDGYIVAADSIRSQILEYKSELQNAQNAVAVNDFQAAKNHYERANQLCYKCAEKPGLKIPEMEAKIHPVVTPPPPTNGGTGTGITPNPPAAQVHLDPAQQNSQWIEKGNTALNQHKLAEAKKLFQQVLNSDKNNPDAKQGMAKIAEELNDPGKTHEALAKALRSFYAQDFGSAAADLEDFIASDRSSKKGLAYFYLGALRLEESMLTTPNSKHGEVSLEVVKNFTKAASLGYRPDQRFVSPRLLAVWSNYAPK